MAVAASGKVFVSEDAPPRVFLRLSADLQYEKLWAGPWYLSGEVTVDPENPQYVYMWSHEAFIRHVVDYEKKTSRPDAVWSDFALPLGSYARWYPRIVHHDGQTYMFCGGTNASAAIENSGVFRTERRAKTASTTHTAISHQARCRREKTKAVPAKASRTNSAA